MIDAPHTSTRRAGPVRRLVRAWRSRGAGRGLAADRRLVGGIVASIATSRPGAASWSILDARPGDPSLFLLGRPGGEADAVLRVAHEPSARTGLVRAAAALDALGTTGAAGEPGPLEQAGLRIPAVIARSEDGAPSWLAETALTGVVGTTALADPAARRTLLRGAASAARLVSGLAPETRVVGAPEIERWVTGRVRVIAPLVGDVPGPAGSAGASLEALGADLSAALVGRSIGLGWIHGDLWPANVLIDPATGRVSGLVDWDSAEPGEPILQDLLHLALTTRRRVERRDLGALIVELLNGAPWAEDDLLVLGSGAAEPTATDSDGAADPPDLAAFGGLDRATAVWLYWLRAIDINLVRHPELAADRRWVDANVGRVLACR